MNLDKLRQKYLNMTQYNFDATIRKDLFTEQDIADIEKYGNWFNAIWNNEVPLTTSKLKNFYAAKSKNCEGRTRLEELWYKYKKYELPF